MEEGTPVVFTASHLGLISSIHASKFEDATVSRGDTGVYLGKHPDLNGWHLVRVGELFCPVHESQIRPVEPTEPRPADPRP